MDLLKGGPVPGSEYVCGDCGHLFRTPDDAPRDLRSLMCPSCGSISLSIVHTERAAPVVMRAKDPVTAPAKAGDSR
jgi:DNA-directed RNA polymerase subunit RPC12/RpoP